MQRPVSMDSGRRDAVPASRAERDPEEFLHHGITHSADDDNNNESCSSIPGYLESHANSGNSSEGELSSRLLLEQNQFTGLTCSNELIYGQGLTPSRHDSITCNAYCRQPSVCDQTNLPPGRHGFLPLLTASFASSVSLTTEETSVLDNPYAQMTTSPVLTTEFSIIRKSGREEESDSKALRAMEEHEFSLSRSKRHGKSRPPEHSINKLESHQPNTADSSSPVSHFAELDLGDSDLQQPFTTSCSVTPSRDLSSSFNQATSGNRITHGCDEVVSNFSRQHFHISGTESTSISTTTIADLTISIHPAANLARKQNSLTTAMTRAPSRHRRQDAGRKTQSGLTRKSLSTRRRAREETASTNSQNPLILGLSTEPADKRFLGASCAPIADTSPVQPKSCLQVSCYGDDELESRRISLIFQSLFDTARERNAVPSSTSKDINMSSVTNYSASVPQRPIEADANRHPQAATEPSSSVDAEMRSRRWSSEESPQHASGCGTRNVCHQKVMPDQINSQDEEETLSESLAPGSKTTAGVSGGIKKRLAGSIRSFQESFFSAESSESFMIPFSYQDEQQQMIARDEPNQPMEKNGMNRHQSSNERYFTSSSVISILKEYTCPAASLALLKLLRTEAPSHSLFDFSPVFHSIHHSIQESLLPPSVALLTACSPLKRQTKRSGVDSQRRSILTNKRDERNSCCFKSECSEFPSSAETGSSATVCQAKSQPGLSDTTKRNVVPATRESRTARKRRSRDLGSRSQRVDSAAVKHNRHISEQKEPTIPTRSLSSRPSLHESILNHNTSRLVQLIQPAVSRSPNRRSTSPCSTPLRFVDRARLPRRQTGKFFKDFIRPIASRVLRDREVVKEAGCGFKRVERHETSQLQPSMCRTIQSSKLSSEPVRKVAVQGRTVNAEHHCSADPLHEAPGPAPPGQTAGLLSAISLTRQNMCKSSESVCAQDSKHTRADQSSEQNRPSLREKASGNGSSAHSIGLSQFHLQCPDVVAEGGPAILSARLARRASRGKVILESRQHQRVEFTSVDLCNGSESAAAMKVDGSVSEDKKANSENHLLSMASDSSKLLTPSGSHAHIKYLPSRQEMRCAKIAPPKEQADVSYTSKSTDIKTTHDLVSVLLSPSTLPPRQFPRVPSMCSVPEKEVGKNGSILPTHFVAEAAISVPTSIDWDGAQRLSGNQIIMRPKWKEPQNILPSSSLSNNPPLPLAFRCSHSSKEYQDTQVPTPCWTVNTEGINSSSPSNIQLPSSRHQSPPWCHFAKAAGSLIEKTEGGSACNFLQQINSALPVNSNPVSQQVPFMPQTNGFLMIARGGRLLPPSRHSVNWDSSSFAVNNSTNILKSKSLLQSRYPVHQEFQSRKPLSYDVDCPTSLMYAQYIQRRTTTAAPNCPLPQYSPLVNTEEYSSPGQHTIVSYPAEFSFPAPHNNFTSALTCSNNSARTDAAYGIMMSSAMLPCCQKNPDEGSLSMWNIGVDSPAPAHFHPSNHRLIKTTTSSNHLLPNVVSNEVINRADLSLESIVNKGTFGTVFLGRWKCRKVAIKVFHYDIPGVMTIEEMKNLEREVATYRHLKHPSIVHYIGLCMEPPFFAIITEYLPGGNVFELFFDEPIEISAEIRYQIAEQLTSCICFMHNSRPAVIHRDLKTANLVLDNHFNVKLCDFGKTMLMTGSHLLLDDNGGSPRYMAPECFKPNGWINQKSDVWSLACCLIEIFGGPIPHEELIDNESVINRVVMENKAPSVPCWFHPRLRCILEQCFSWLPQNRPQAWDILRELKAISPDVLRAYGMICSIVKHGHQGASFVEMIRHRSALMRRFLRLLLHRMRFPLFWLTLWWGGFQQFLSRAYLTNHTLLTSDKSCGSLNYCP